MNFRAKIKRKISGRTIGKGISDIKATINAFDGDVKDIPDKVNHCEHCQGCRNRAKATSRAFRKHFAQLLRGR